MQAGPVNLTITYLMPIEPSDWIQQSLPFSYVSLEVVSTDGAPHNVEAYADINGAWLSGDGSSEIQWSTVVGDDIVYHEISLASPTPFQEINQQANDGVMYHAISQGPGVTWQTGANTACRWQFNLTGNLTNGVDTDFRPITNNHPVFAFAVNLGSIESTAAPVVWSLGYVRNPVIQYSTPSGNDQLRSPLFLTQYSSVIEAMTAFVVNYSSASQRAQAFDRNVTEAATNISSEYAGVLSLALRTSFGGLDVTVSNGTDGQLNASDVKTFMKDLGSSRRVNPVEVLYQAFPMYLYLNASFAKSLLSPLLEYQDSALYHNPYAAMDLGPNYPVAAGDNYTHNAGVEQTGNMLIMTLAHARISGDGSLIGAHYELLKSWADYLVNNTLMPTADQQSADREEIANLTNLAVKGIIAIAAMAEMSRAVGDTERFEQYSKQSSALIKTWESLALSSDQQHLLLDYGDLDATWALVYNLYADRLLGLDLINPSIYEKQTMFYQGLIAGNSGDAFGLPLDSNNTVINAAWLLFTSATASNNTLVRTLVSAVWNHILHHVDGGILPLTYNAAQGQLVSNTASPGNGAMFALLALDIPNTTILVSSQFSGAGSSMATGSAHSSDGGTRHLIIGAVIGGLVGGVCVLGLLLTARFVWRHKTRGTKCVAVEPFVSRTSDHPLPAPPQPGSRETAAITYTITTPPSSMEPPSDQTLGVPVLDFTPVATRHNRPLRALNLNSDNSPRHMLKLREEVANLRRVMQTIRAGQLIPPPEYTSDGGSAA
ncbi:hypothetical protein CERSUDRAFT_118047 [Gelatoporia subvermispora B]|uniref:DUF1793-domain-containing protein n=1 Tax=Ceriporiopsis subvermispora (strain B) TaxID=914234 RepID=M2PCN7_CERS8|nr:hypothetical protein CERSUDRAFT_118047 [Gelatoporia subvermispora B]